MEDSRRPPGALTLFIASLCACSIPLLAWAFATVLLRPIPDEYQWLALTGFILVTVPLFIDLPSANSLVTIGDAFVISICMLSGSERAILANTLWIGFFSLLWKRKHHTEAYKIVFNISSGVLNVSIYGFVYHSLRQVGNEQLGLLISTLAVAVSFYVSNSFFVATAISLSTKSQRSILSVWRENYRTISLDYFVSACAAAFIKLMGSNPLVGTNPLFPVLVAPFVGAIWGINKIYKAKALDAETHLKEQQALYLRTVESLALAIDAKDQTTYGHIRRVRAYAMGLAAKVGLHDSNELSAIENGSLLHDIGKLAVDDYILNKPGTLTAQEFEKMKVHSTAGHEILEQIKFPFPVARLVRAHHEKWNGQGYPDGLRAHEIPLGARILAIADSYDTIRSSRPYKRPCTTTEAVESLQAKAGVFFDPDLVKVFVDNIVEFEAAADQASKQMAELSFRKTTPSIAIPPDTPSDSATPLAFRLPADVSEELVRIGELTSLVSGTVQPEEALNILARRLQKLLPYSTFAVYVDNGDATVRAALAVGKCSERLQDVKVELGKGISGWVAAYRHPLLNSAPALEFGDDPQAASSLTDSLAVPVVHQDVGVGALLVFAEPPTRYTTSDLLMLATVANLISPLIGSMGPEASNGETGSVECNPTLRDAGHLAVATTNLINLTERTRAPFSLVLFDLPNYNHVSRLCGATVAEHLVHKIAVTLAAELREIDTLARYGQHALVALVPGLRSEQASRYGLKLRRNIQNVNVPDLLEYPISLQCEVGVSTFPSDGFDLPSLLSAARRAIHLRIHQSPAQASDSEANVVEFPPRSTV